MFNSLFLVTNIYIYIYSLTVLHYRKLILFNCKQLRLPDSNPQAFKNKMPGKLKLVSLRHISHPLIHKVSDVLSPTPQPWSYQDPLTMLWAPTPQAWSYQDTLTFLVFLSWFLCTFQLYFQILIFTPPVMTCATSLLYLGSASKLFFLLAKANICFHI